MVHKEEVLMVENLKINGTKIIDQELLEKKKTLKIENIVKSFPGVKALKSVSLDFKSGQIHALVGENGAGKSTLIKVISGIYVKDEGNIYIDGENVEIKNPRAAVDLGISVIHQEFSLISELDVAHNIFLGIEPTSLKGFKLNKKFMYKRSKEILKSLNAHIDVKAPVYQLPVPDQQSVEIAKALIRKAWLFIMDEPTSALTDKEKQYLFKIVKNLAEKGAAIIYISHHLEEIFEIADKISILRDGRLVGTYGTKDLTQHEVANLMVDKEVNIMFSRNRVEAGKTIMEVKDLQKKNTFHGISFKVRAGEVLGFSGLLGSGRSELCRAIYGLDKFDSGHIFLEGKKIAFRNPLDAIKSSVLYSPQDRRLEGIIPLMPCDENLTLKSLYWMSLLGWISSNTQKKVSTKLIKNLDIKASSLKQKLLNLSGGNQQKVLIGKCLSKMPKVLILDDPTRGIDVGAKEEIYKIIEKLAEDGVAIIIVSPELQELIGISDRILTFLNGRIINEYTYPDFEQSKILADILIETDT
jgi:ribose transport system ATP-binding protein